MVVLGKKFGRLANRLWIFSSFAANAIEYKYPLTYRNFDEFIPYFEATSSNDFLGYPIRTKLSSNVFFDKILYLLSFLWYNLALKHLKKAPGFLAIHIERKGKGFDLNNRQFVEMAQSKKRVYIGRGGLWYKDNTNIQTHKEKIRQFFKPIRKYEKAVEDFITTCRNKSDCLVGVHLRKKDYKTYRGGKLYLNDSAYFRNISKMNDLLKTRGLKPLFILCSDEPVVEDNFTDLPIITGLNHMILDLYTFANCDYIIGPASTYTLWASYYGDVPLKFLARSESEETFDLSDFRIAKSIDDLLDILT